MTQYSIVPYNPALAKQGFCCGDVALDDYLSRYAGQDEKRNIAKCYLLLSATNEVAGYYTLSSGSVLLDQLPESARKKLPRYPTVPIVRLGRLAVALEYQGQGLGGMLLVNALRRIETSGIGCYALFVEAKSPKAVSFYKHFGFVSLRDDEKMLFLPITKTMHDTTPHLLSCKP